ncbi:hypothetical protein MHUMG1_08012 [Metarhizium humberi]|uniref:Uncharacterized protein n=1 Tax=Metarhizium humberi TaxID=2596975 RepID=A0A9P8M5H0_9HYPO|nr:hypothetical protein MHUMG1_08012 [Metarhizium humberi]
MTHQTLTDDTPQLRIGETPPQSVTVEAPPRSQTKTKREKISVPQQHTANNAALHKLPLPPAPGPASPAALPVDIQQTVTRRDALQANLVREISPPPTSSSNTGSNGEDNKLPATPPPTPRCAAPAPDALGRKHHDIHPPRPTPLCPRRPARRYNWRRTTACDSRRDGRGQA